MAEKQKQRSGERLARAARDFNAFGAVALGSLAALIPGPNVILASLATIDIAQAGGFELLRRRAARKREAH